MQTQSEYTTLLHTEYVDSFLNPKTDSVEPNFKLRKFVVDYVKSGKPVIASAMAREYSLTNKKVTRQRMAKLLKQLGVYAK